MIAVTATECQTASDALIEDATPRRLAIECAGDRSGELARRTVARLFEKHSIPADARLGSTVSLSKLGIDGLFRALESGKGLAERWREFLAPSILPTSHSPRSRFGPSVTAIGACATGLHTWIRAAMLLENDEADIVVAGSAEATLNELVIGGFRKMGVLTSTRPRPFDRRRDGFVPAEGAAMALLEREEDARARGAKIIGRLEGWAMMGGTGQIASGAISPDAISGLVEAGLLSAGREKRDVSYVHLHGTGTVSNDCAEAAFLRVFFERDGLIVPASSTKALTGHCLGAAGAIEAVLTLEALVRRSAPPNYGMEEIDQSCRSECLVREDTTLNDGVGIVLSYGFGGVIAALILSACSGEAAL